MILIKNQGLGCMKLRRIFDILSIFLAVSIFSLFLSSGCSQRNLNGPVGEPAHVSFKMASPLAPQWIGVVQLTITGPGIVNPIVDTLSLNGTIISGTAEIPTGENRRLLVEARESTGSNQGLVIYRGETTIDIIPNTTVELNMNLYPAVPMVRLAPRFLPITLGSTFALDLRAYNLENLSAITTQLRFERGQFRVDSIIRNKDLPENTYFLISDSLQYFIVDIRSISIHQSLTDSAGFADLATIYFKSVAVFEADQTVDSTDVSIWCYLQISGVSTIPTNLRFGASTIEINRDSTGMGLQKRPYALMEDLR